MVLIAILLIHSSPPWTWFGDPIVFASRLMEKLFSHHHSWEMRVYQGQAWSIKRQRSPRIPLKKKKIWKWLPTLQSSKIKSNGFDSPFTSSLFTVLNKLWVSYWIWVEPQLGWRISHTWIEWNRLINIIRFIRNGTLARLRVKNQKKGLWIIKGAFVQEDSAAMERHIVLPPFCCLVEHILLNEKGKKTNWFFSLMERILIFYRTDRNIGFLSPVKT